MNEETYATCKDCKRPHCKIVKDGLCGKCAAQAEKRQEEIAKLAKWMKI